MNPSTSSSPASPSSSTPSSPASVGSSVPFGLTAPPPSSSTPAGSTSSPTPSPSSGSSSTTTSRATSSSTGKAIRYNDRLFATGTTRSGKSHLMRKIFLSVKAPRLVIDPADSELTDVPGAVTFRDPSKATNKAGQNWREAATARFVPHDPYDIDEYDEVYGWAFRHFPRWLWSDEVTFPLPSHGGSKKAKLILAQGGKRQLGHGGCNPRPIDCNRALVAQSEHVFVFDTPVAGDRRYLADNMGVGRDQFEALHAALPVHGFLHFDRRAKTLTPCAPLPR